MVYSNEVINYGRRFNFSFKYSKSDLSLHYPHNGTEEKQYLLSTSMLIATDSSYINF